MADNRVGYGFRWFIGRNGSRAMPTPEMGSVATAQAFNVNAGAQGVSIGRGDPVIKLSTGGFTLCDGAEGAGGALTPYGVCVGVLPFYNVAKGRMEPTALLPSAVAWGTLLERQSKILVVPFPAGIWEIDCDDIVTATTEAAYAAFNGENCDYRLNGIAGGPRAVPRLDISSHAAATATLVLRIRGNSPNQENRDYSGQFVKLLVEANLAQFPEFSAVGV